MDEARDRWQRPGFPTEATGRARLAYLAAALAQHCLLVSAYGLRKDEGWSPAVLLWTPAQVLILAAVLFGRPLVEVEEEKKRLVGRIVCLSTALAMLGAPLVDGELPLALIGCAFFGSLYGAAVAVVFHPLLVLVDQWRRRGSLRSLLDAWTALALYPAVAGLIQSSVSSDLRASALARSSLALCAVALVIALGVSGYELWWRRLLRRALAGALPGSHVTTDASHARDQVPDWSLTPTTRRAALAVWRPASSYRNLGTEAVVASLPTKVAMSWRLYALPALVVVVAWRWLAP